jgi:hypothetical protein
MTCRLVTTAHWTANPGTRAGDPRESPTGGAAVERMPAPRGLGATAPCSMGSAPGRCSSAVAPSLGTHKKVMTAELTVRERWDVAGDG